MDGKRSTWIRLVALLAGAVLVLGACGDPDTTEPGDQDTPTEDAGAEVTTIEEGILTVGTDIPYPPFEYREGGKEVGFDVDLITEIAARLNLEVKFVDTGFDTIFTQLATGRFDVVVAASTITEDREKEVNFSDGYYNSQQSLTVNEDSSVATIADLAEGDVVGVQNGTTGKDYAEENVPEGVKIRSFPEGPDAYAALEAGAVDAVINDESVAIAEVEARQGLELVETIDTGEVYGIAVNPENEALLDAVNEKLGEMIEDGTYEEIFSKYPDLPPGGNVAAS